MADVIETQERASDPLGFIPLLVELGPAEEQEASVPGLNHKVEGEDCQGGLLRAEMAACGPLYGLFRAGLGSWAAGLSAIARTAPCSATSRPEASKGA